MKTDEYFMEKASHIESICENTARHPFEDDEREQLIHEIYISLKEIAKDQRYASIEAIQQHPFEEIKKEFAMQKIHSADIGGRE